MTLKECCKTKCNSFHKQVIKCYIIYLKNHKLEVSEKLAVKRLNFSGL